MDYKEILAQESKNRKELQENDNKAKSEGKAVGRYIQHPFADGYAVYKIIRENKKSYRLEVVTGIGDDWVLPAWGGAVTLPKTKVLEFLRQRDFWNELMATKARGVGIE
jgi:hypothetical protein